MRYPLIAGLTFFLSVNMVFAQARVSIRPTPKPGQVIHVTTKQEIQVRTGVSTDEPGPAAMRNNNSLAFTQTNGTFNAEGQLQAQVTVERLDVDESLGGHPRSGIDTTSLKGRVLVVTLDRTGKLLGIQVPPDIENTLSLRLTQLLAGSYGMLNFVPAADLGVGQDTNTVTELPMRVPGAASREPLQARTTVTLTAVESKGTDRIARLRQDVDVATASSQLKVTGGGTMDVNLDRGFVSATDIEWKIASSAQTGSSGRQSPPFFGTIRITVSAN